MEARDSFCFPKNTKNPNLSPIGKKFGFCCYGAPPGTRTLGPLIKRASRRFVSIYGSFESSLFLIKQCDFLPGNFCTLCPILQRFAPFARFETVQKPCRNRALTPRQTKIHFIRQRLDGIGLGGHSLIFSTCCITSRLESI